MTANPILTPWMLERAGWVAVKYAGRIYWMHETTHFVRHNWGSAVQHEIELRKVAR